MKTTMTMKTTKMLGAGMALILIGAIPLSGQGVVAPSQECQSGVIEGTLGISGWTVWESARSCSAGMVPKIAGSSARNPDLQR